jgi:hypothetical protein
VVSAWLQANETSASIGYGETKQSKAKQSKAKQSAIIAIAGRVGCRAYLMLKNDWGCEQQGRGDGQASELICPIFKTLLGWRVVISFTLHF